MGHERAKANGEFEKLLPPAASLAVGDIDHGGIATATSSAARRRLSLLPERGARRCRPSIAAPPEQCGTCPSFPTVPVIIRYGRPSPKSGTALTEGSSSHERGPEVRALHAPPLVKVLVLPGYLLHEPAPLGKRQGGTTLIIRYCPLLPGHQKILYSAQPIE